jgi:hypothetical protein
LRGPGNGPAYERAHAKLRQAAEFPDRKVLRQDFLTLGDDPSGFRFDEADLASGVEHRRNPVVPVCKRRLHGTGSPWMFVLDRTATVVPNVDSAYEAPIMS